MIGYNNKKQAGEQENEGDKKKNRNVRVPERRLDAAFFLPLLDEGEAGWS
jgi:hypothetical protein